MEAVPGKPRSAFPSFRLRTYSQSGYIVSRADDRIGRPEPRRTRRLLRRHSAAQSAGTSAQPGQLEHDSPTCLPIAIYARGAMSYAFRIRFALSGHVRLNSAPEPEIPIVTPSGEDVILRALQPGQALQDAEQLVLLGRGYRSEPDAREAGLRWRGFVERALARVNVGANFGDRAPGSYMAAEYLGILAQQWSVQRVVQDEHGLMVFEAEPWPKFALSTVQAVVGRPAPRLAKAIEKAKELSVAMSDRERTAFDLYSGSMFVASLADARFLMLMMAMETLIEQEARSDAAVAHVERLVRETKAAELPADEIRSLASSLQFLKRESISGAGRRLAQRLGDRTYGDPTKEPPAKFFTGCYNLRSSLVHGALPPPRFSEVNGRVAGLELMVSDLLSGDLLEGFDLESWTPA